MKEGRKMGVKQKEIVMMRWRIRKSRKRTKKRMMMIVCVVWVFLRFVVC